MYFKDQVIGRIQTWLLHGAAAPFLGKKTQIANLFYTNQPTYLPTLQPKPTYLTTYTYLPYNLNIPTNLYPRLGKNSSLNV